MKIRFPDHLTGGVTREPLRAMNQKNAPIRLVAELQMETGWDLKTFREAQATMYSIAMAAWLTLHNAGFTTVTWDQTAELSTEDLEFIEEPGDRAAAEQALAESGEGDASDPASPASSRDAEPAEPRKAATRSKNPSRGSQAKSARGSRTS
ncbi:hypothetical protein [Microbacterium sp.]|uniref:hypothetical protein n=1 Tax=Microbacterium sp. TaxID=51671 RepID=UPI002810DDA5|nr:hypothetical protein [Microbacterium sp.]